MRDYIKSRLKRQWITGFIVVMALFLRSGTSRAQDSITLSPERVSVAAIKGGVETRTLLLRTFSPINNAKVVIPDIPRDDGGAVMSSSAIQIVEPPPAQLTPNTPIRVSVRFDFTNVASGRYSGNLLLDHDGGTFMIPVAVTVKDSWPLPLIVLGIGVLVGVIVSTYRTRSKPRDEILLRIARLQAQSRADPPLEAFQDQIRDMLVDVERSLQSGEIPEAQQKVKAAEDVWYRWRKEREGWLAQRQYRDELVKYLAQIRPRGGTVSAFQQQIAEGLRSALNDISGTPDDVTKRLESIKMELARYADLNRRIGGLNEQRNRLPAEQAEVLRQVLLNLQNELENLVPGDATSYRNMLAEINKADQMIKEASSRAPGGTRSIWPGGSPKSLEAAEIPLPSAPPVPGIGQDSDVGKGAGLRLGGYMVLSYGLLLLFLVLTGYGQLYDGQVTFGASGLSDYFTLFAFGFSAEATRAVVTEFLRSGEITAGR